MGQQLPGACCAKDQAKDSEYQLGEDGLPRLVRVLEVGQSSLDHNGAGTTDARGDGMARTTVTTEACLGHSDAWRPTSPLSSPEKRCAPCCRDNDVATESIQTGASMLETLSYSPVRFDAAATLDVERSQQRYSRIVVHSTRARTRKRSKVWEDWLRTATSSGRQVTLVGTLEVTREVTGEDSVPACRRIAAMCHLDQAHTRLSVRPLETGDCAEMAATVRINDILVICSASDRAELLDWLVEDLDPSEKACVIFLEYASNPENLNERKRLCFLEESEAARDGFLQAFTALWLEKRTNHSVWF